MGAPLGTPDPMSPQHRAMLDAAAQKQGFRDFEAYKLWNMQREQQHQGSVAGGGSGGQQSAPPQQQQQPQNHLNTFGGMIDYIRRSMGGH